MKSTNHLAQSNSRQNSARNQDNQQEGWFSIPEYDNQAGTSVGRFRSALSTGAGHGDSSFKQQLVKSKENIDADHSGVDFRTSPSSRDGMDSIENNGMDTVNTRGNRDGSAFHIGGNDDVKEPLSPSPVSSSRLLLQESIDGDVSSTSEHSVQSDSQMGSLRYSSQSSQNNNQSMFSPLVSTSHQANNTTSITKHEWINLTDASNMQDVDRPDPIGRTELTADAQKKQQPSVSSTLPKYSPTTRHNTWASQNIHQTSPQGQQTTEQDVLQTQQKSKRSASHSPLSSPLSPQSSPRNQRSSPHIHYTQEQNMIQHDSYQIQQPVDTYQQNTPHGLLTISPKPTTATEKISTDSILGVQQKHKSWSPLNSQEISSRGQHTTQQDALRAQQLARRSASYSPSSPRSSPQAEQEFSQTQQNYHHHQQKASKHSTSNLNHQQISQAQQDSNYTELTIETQQESNTTLSDQSLQHSPQFSPADENLLEDTNSRKPQRHKSWIPQTQQNSHQIQKRLVSHSPSWSPGNSPRQNSHPAQQPSNSTSNVNVQSSHQQTTSVRVSHHTESTVDTHKDSLLSAESSQDSPQISPTYDKMPNNSKTRNKRSASHSPSSWSPQNSPRSSPLAQQDFLQNQQNSYHVQQKPSSHSTSNIKPQNSYQQNLTENLLEAQSNSPRDNDQIQQPSYHVQQELSSHLTPELSLTTVSSRTLQQNENITDTLSRLSIKSKTTTDDSDIPDLSYTQSLPDSQFNQHQPNKRLGHLPNNNLQQSYSTGTLSGSSSSSGKKSVSSTSDGHFTASRFSNETPVTKLLGPAYKQTERFLKDLQHAKLSYTNNETNHSDNGFDEGTHSKLSVSVSSKNESTQFGKSMTSQHSFNQKLPSPENLTEQDIASASILDVELSVGNVIQSRINQPPSNDEQSEGELLISELSHEAASIRKRSSISKTTSSSQTSSSLEPIKEVTSPERLIINNISNNKNHFPINHMTNSTSTPNFGATGRPSPQGIYDIRDSTSPGSTNRKRMIKSATHLQSRSRQPTDPLKVYVSEGSRRTESSSLDPFSEASNLSLTTNGTSKRSLLSQSSDLTLTTKTASKKHSSHYLPSEASRLSLDIQASSNKQDKTKRIPLDPVSEISNLTLNTNTNTTSKRSSIDPLSEASHSSLITEAAPTKRRSHKHAIPTKDTSLSAYRNIDATPVSVSSAHNTTESSSGRPMIKKRIDVVPPLSYNYPITNENNNHLDYSSSRHEDDHSPKTIPKRSRVFPKSLNNMTSDSSYVGNETTDSERSKHEERQKNLQNASLNQLWESFEKSYQNTISDNKSPLLKKLEVVSNLLKESRERSIRRRHMTSLTGSSDDTDTTVTSYCEAHTPRQSLTNISKSRDQTRTISRPLLDRKPGKSDSKDNTPNVCPVCQRREIGTNFPTPIVSESDIIKNKVEKDEPLTLQTWTQTSPYIIETKLSERGVLNNKKHHRTSGNHKDAYTLYSSPSKENRSLTSSSSSSTDQSRKKKDVPYTAWFQSTRSDNSDVVPLCKIPELGSLFSKTLERKMRRQEKRQEPQLTLQDAFRRRKRDFIKNSETRLQEFRDVFQRDKHGAVFNGRSNYQDGNIAVEKQHGIQERLSSNRADTERSRERSIRSRSTKTPLSSRRSPPVNTPRKNYQFLEQQRVQNLRMNRLKMKQYDLKNRERFLKRRAKNRIKKPQYVVVRH